VNDVASRHLFIVDALSFDLIIGTDSELLIEEICLAVVR
jgi:hypothetical protein